VREREGGEGGGRERGGERGRESVGVATGGGAEGTHCARPVDDLHTGPLQAEALRGKECLKAVTSLSCSLRSSSVLLLFAELINLRTFIMSLLSSYNSCLPVSFQKFATYILLPKTLICPPIKEIGQEHPSPHRLGGIAVGTILPTEKASAYPLPKTSPSTSPELAPPPMLSIVALTSPIRPGAPAATVIAR
jgi:hypothetical protein